MSTSVRCSHRVPRNTNDPVWAAVRGRGVAVGRVTDGEQHLYMWGRPDTPGVGPDHRPLRQVGTRTHVLAHAHTYTHTHPLSDTHKQ
jgi:hypothetical protein